MATEQNGGDGDAHQEPDFAQAFKEIARGEQAAAALENHLDSLEKKIEDLLAKADEDEKNTRPQPGEPTRQSPPQDDNKGASQ